jgi:hypothetical protein
MYGSAWVGFIADREHSMIRFPPLLESSIYPHQCAEYPTGDCLFFFD